MNEHSRSSQNYEALRAATTSFDCLAPAGAAYPQLIEALDIVMLAVFSASLDAQLAPLDLSATAREFLAKQHINLAAAEIPPDLSATAQDAVQQAINLEFVTGFRVVIGIAWGWRSPA